LLLVTAISFPSVKAFVSLILRLGAEFLSNPFLLLDRLLPLALELLVLLLRYLQIQVLL
jgi:hypothetical protein